MSHRVLDAPMTAWRIGDPNGEFPIWDDGGARREEGRWHRAGSGVIYASLSYSTAMLEKLVHYSGVLPRGQHFIEITRPQGISYEIFSEAHHPAWANRDGKVARAFGDKWLRDTCSAILIVPSVVARAQRHLQHGTPRICEHHHLSRNPCLVGQQVVRAMIAPLLLGTRSKCANGL